VDDANRLGDTSGFPEVVPAESQDGDLIGMPAKRSAWNCARSG